MKPPLIHERDCKEASPLEALYLPQRAHLESLAEEAYGCVDIYQPIQTQIAAGTLLQEH